MSKMIQIRNVPEGVHREVKARAAKAGLTLSDYLKRELERMVAVPTTEDVLARIRSRTRAVLSETPAEIIRSERDAR